MSLIASIVASARRAACVYALGGPVGAYHSWKIARNRRRMAQVSEYISAERDLHREHLRTLNYEFSELVSEQQRLNFDAAQFWSWCDKKAQGR